MKGKNLREVQEDYKATIVGLCLICDKPVNGWYGRWSDRGTCSKKCEQVQEAKPKYPEKGEGNAVIPQGSNTQVGE